MCIIAVAHRADPRWPLIVAANRDERHERPSESLKRWGTSPDVIAGRDSLAGGTWLGVTEAGRFAAVSNLRGDRVPPTGLSRGKLVTDFLLDAALPTDRAAMLFNPFNMIVVDGDGAQFLSNRPEPRSAGVGEGVHVFSNGAFDDEWPKTKRLKRAIGLGLLADTLTPGALFEYLFMDAHRDVGKASIDDAVFVRHPAYGTRCSTVMTIDTQGHGQIIERRFDAAANVTGETALTFTWPASP